MIKARLLSHKDSLTMEDLIRIMFLSKLSKSRRTKLSGRLSKNSKRVTLTMTLKTRLRKLRMSNKVLIWIAMKKVMMMTQIVFRRFPILIS